MVLPCRRSESKPKSEINPLTGSTIRAESDAANIAIKHKPTSHGMFSQKANADQHKHFEQEHLKQKVPLRIKAVDPSISFRMRPKNKFLLFFVPLNIKANDWRSHPTLIGFRIETRKTRSSFRILCESQSVCVALLCQQCSNRVVWETLQTVFSLDTRRCSLGEEPTVLFPVIKITTNGLLAIIFKLVFLQDRKPISNLLEFQIDSN